MTQDAQRWVETEVARLRRLSYQDLLRIRGAPRHHEISTIESERVVGEVQAFWDDRCEGNLRVVVDAWKPKRGLIRSIATDEFIVTPAGAFLDE